MAQSMAAQWLPKVAARMPTVYVCTPETFAPYVAGTYTSGLHQIRMRQETVGTAQFSDSLLHELAHAAAWLEGGDNAARDLGGHGEVWLRIMLRLGRHEDARRHVGSSPAGLMAFRAAENSVAAEQARQLVTGGPPPASPPSPLARAGAPGTNGSVGTLTCSGASCGGRVATVFEMAEIELRDRPCQQVLKVPGGYAGSLSYPLRVQVRLLVPLPQHIHRIVGVAQVAGGQLHMQVSPSPDGTPSLVCLQS